MAIVNNNYSPSETKVGIAEELTFGTAIADAGTFFPFEIPPGDVPEPDYGLMIDHEPRSTKSRVLEEGMGYTTEYGGVRVIPVSNHIVRAGDLADIIYGSGWDLDSEAVGTPFEKIFSLSGSAGTATTPPDFTSNAGYFATIGIYDPIASNHRKFRSCVCRMWELSFDLTGGDGRLRANHEWISGFATADTANFSGTWDYRTQLYYNFHDLTLKSVDGSDVVIYSFNLRFENGAQRIGTDTSGQAETYDFPFYRLTGSITMKYDSVTDGLIANQIDGLDDVDINIACEADGDAGNLEFTINDTYVRGAPKSYDDTGQRITLEFEAQADSSTGNLATIEFSDAVERSW